MRFIWRFFSRLPQAPCCIRFQICAEKNGVTHAPIELVHGDFLTNSVVKDAISSAGIVFINNPKFGPELNLKVLSEYEILFFNFCLRVVLITASFSEQLCPLIPKNSKLVCFDSLIGTPPRIPYNNILTYRKLLKVFRTTY